MKEHLMIQQSEVWDTFVLKALSREGTKTVATFRIKWLDLRLGKPLGTLRSRRYVGCFLSHASTPQRTKRLETSC